MLSILKIKMIFKKLQKSMSLKVKVMKNKKKKVELVQ